MRILINQMRRASTSDSIITTSRDLPDFLANSAQSLPLPEHQSARLIREWRSNPEIQSEPFYPDKQFEAELSKNIKALIKNLKKDKISMLAVNSALILDARADHDNPRFKEIAYYQHVFFKNLFAQCSEQNLALAFICYEIKDDEKTALKTEACQYLIAQHGKNHPQMKVAMKNYDYKGIESDSQSVEVVKYENNLRELEATHLVARELGVEAERGIFIWSFDSQLKTQIIADEMQNKTNLNFQNFILSKTRLGMFNDIRAWNVILERQLQNDTQTQNLPVETPHASPVSFLVQPAAAPTNNKNCCTIS